MIKKGDRVEFLSSGGFDFMGYDNFTECYGIAEEKEDNAYGYNIAIYQKKDDELVLIFFNGELHNIGYFYSDEIKKEEK